MVKDRPLVIFSDEILMAWVNWTDIMASYLLVVNFDERDIMG